MRQVSIEIRLLGAADGALLDSAVSSFRGPGGTGERFLAQPSSVAFVALAGDEVVGWAWGFREVRPDGRDQVLLYQLDTAEGWRRQGIGTALVRAVLDLARDEGFVRVWLVSNKGNTEAVGVYRRLGAVAYQDDDVVYRWDVNRPEAHPLQ